MGAFLGQLSVNEVYPLLYNMIIGQEIFVDKISIANALCDEARTEGGLHGDRKLFYDGDVLPVHDFGYNSSDGTTGHMDLEAGNLLAVDRPAAPSCQEIVLNIFKQIRVTLDDYISKRAWSDERTFMQFTAFMEGMLTKTKRVYDKTTYDAFIGTEVTSTGKQSQTVDISGASTNQQFAEIIAEKIANILSEMQDVSRDYNDYGHLTAFDNAVIKIIWNSKYVNKIKHIDLPEIFNASEVFKGLKFEQKVLNEKYFGTRNSSDATGDEKWVRALECGYAKKSGSSDVFVFAGEFIPTGYKLGANKTYSTGSTSSGESPVDTPNKDICKIVVKLPPFMSAMEVGSSFYNARSLTTNRYSTYGHNTLEHLSAYPFVTLSEAVPANDED